MSWQLGSFALVLASLALAFWWYERSHPPAKIVAIVGTLAALAALGRDAFAAVPDVKPITAIVLVSGLAFGAGPGFAIGAISGLASNVLLGEGPWTPWQMLGWGLVGLIGAALGALTRRRSLPPLVLALACAVSAEVFNLVVDLYTWMGTGNHTLAGFGVVLGLAVAFDLTHVLASFAFGLAFGSVLLRMLVRVRARLEVSWSERPPERQPVPASVAGLALIAGLLAVPLLALGGVTPARATPARATLARSARAAAAHPRAAAQPRAGGQPRAHAAAGGPTATDTRLDIAREVSYLAGAQNGDGGFGGARGQGSSELYSAWVAMGLAAAGRDPLSFSRDGHTVLDALRGEASSLQGAGDLERTILALRACGVSVRSLPGGDPVATLLRLRDGDGSFGHLANLTAFAVFALRAAGFSSASAPVRSAGRWLARQQEADGGFGFATRGGGSDVDDTAAVLQALRDAGVRGSASIRAGAFLARTQNLDGGFPQQPGGASNAQSTAWAIQGLIAAGRNVSTLTREGSRSPLGYLESLIAPDGSVHYSRTGSQTPVWVTAQALTALAGRTFPIGPVAAGTGTPARGTSAAGASRVSATARVTRAPAGARARRSAASEAASREAQLRRTLGEIGSIIGTMLQPLVRLLSGVL